MAATAAVRRVRDLGGAAVVTSPDETLKTVWRRRGAPDDSSGSAAGGFAEGAVGGGGGTEKRARSWGSVSRSRLVMSWLERRAVVKIRGCGKLYCRRALLAILGL